MKIPSLFLVCVLSFILAQNALLAETLIKEEPEMAQLTNETTANYNILTITGPNLIEVNTVNVYGFTQYNHYSGPNYHYEWILICADDPSISPFFMGYNVGSICSFICYEPVNLFLWLNVYNADDDLVGHAETMVTVLPEGSLNP